jgi:hypothetical protein
MPGIASFRKFISRLRKAASGFFQDRPFATSGVIALLVTVHAVAGSIWLDSLVPYTELASPGNTGTAVTLYLGTAAASAIVAGFAGVVIVFAVGSPLGRLKRFRHEAGGRLRANWLIVMVEPLTATLLGILASVLQLTGGRVVAPWFFELAICLLIHGASRLVWILGELIKIVGADDEESERAKRKVPLDDLFE